MIASLITIEEAGYIVGRTAEKLGSEPRHGREQAAAQLVEAAARMLSELLEEAGKLAETEARAARVVVALDALVIALADATEAGDEPPTLEGLAIAEPHDGIETWLDEVRMWAAKRTAFTRAFQHGETGQKKRPPKAQIVRHILFDFFADTWRDPDGSQGTKDFLTAFGAIASDRLQMIAQARLIGKSDRVSEWIAPNDPSALRHSVREWRAARQGRHSTGD